MQAREIVQQVEPFALNVAKQELIPSIPYGSLNTARTNSEQRVRNNPWHHINKTPNTKPRNNKPIQLNCRLEDQYSEISCIFIYKQ